MNMTRYAVRPMLTLGAGPRRPTSTSVTTGSTRPTSQITTSQTLNQSGGGLGPGKAAVPISRLEPIHTYRLAMTKNAIFCATADHKGSLIMTKDSIPKAYAQTRHGQVHYRRLGSGSQRVLLIHWLPLSSRMYQHVMPILAARGCDVLAVDLLGYGRSDPRPRVWSMADWAASVAEVAESLGFREALVVGGHSGSCVAVELAIGFPSLVSQLVLDGCPVLTPELRATFKSMQQQSRPVPDTAGSHESLVFRTVRTTYEHYLPGFAVTPESIELLWPAMIDYLETDFVSSAAISAEYELEPRLARIHQPLTLLSADTDTLAGSFAQVCALRPDARQHKFKGHHPLHEPGRALEYVQVISAN
ncbi:MAG: alpha/beta hydrolase [Sinobacteraceae bacterium]|nr:alpha/beta hydrolase [Nevskiaceae bacterium]